MSAFSLSARSRVVAATATGLVLLAAAVPARAGVDGCSLQLDQAPQAVRVDYDPFLPATAPTRLAFRLRNGGEARCEADLAFVDVPGQPLIRTGVGATGLMLEIRPGPSVSRSPEPAVFRTAVEAGETQEIVFDVLVIEDAVVQAGLYDQSLTLEVRQPGAPQAYERSPVIIDLTALPRAQMNLSGARGAFGAGPSISVVDFGEAQTGKTHQLFVQTRTNASARLTFSSANRGKLRHEQGGEAAAVLTYAVAFDGDVLDLSQVATRDVDPPRTFAGQSYGLLLTLGAVEGGPAGVYSDELTIEISTL